MNATARMENKTRLTFKSDSSLSKRMRGPLAATAGPAIILSALLGSDIVPRMPSVVPMTIVGISLLLLAILLLQLRWGDEIVFQEGAMLVLHGGNPKYRVASDSVTDVVIDRFVITVKWRDVDGMDYVQFPRPSFTDATYESLIEAVTRFAPIGFNESSIGPLAL